MQKISFSDLCELEVINLCGGERLGYPVDLEIDLCDNRILSITVRECDSPSIFDKKEEYRIPWKNIECIGSDAILVKLERAECISDQCSTKKKRTKRFF